MTNGDTIHGLLAMYMIVTKQAIMEREGRIPSREELWNLVTDPDNRPTIPPDFLEMDRQDREAGVFDS